MTKLSMGNFKKNLGNPAPVEPVDTPPVEPTTPTEPIEPVPQEPVQPNDTNTDPAPAAEPVQNNNPDGSGEPVPVESSTEPSNVEPAPIELTDELVGSYLSEKLGKPFSFEDLNKEPVNPLDSEPYLKEIYEWRNKTGRPVEDFFKFQKDYSQISDIDIVRENLQLEYPNATAEEINFEIKRLTPSEEDLEEDVTRKNWELKKLATKGRAKLEELKSNLSEPLPTSIPKEFQEKIKYAESIEQQIKESETIQQTYNQNIEKAALETSSIKLSVLDSELDFLIPEQNRKTLPQDISDMSHWKNPDGSFNHKAIVEDGIKIKYFNDILKVATEQAFNAGKDALIKESSNSTLGGAQTVPQPNPSSKGFTIEEPSSGFKKKLTMKSYKR